MLPIPMRLRPSLVVAGLLTLTPALLVSCAAGPDAEEFSRMVTDLQSVSSELRTVKTQATSAAAEASKAAAAVAPRTHRFEIVLGEAQMVVEDAAGKESLGGDSHRWEPDPIVVFKGDKVVLEVTNPRKKVHSLVLKEFGVDTKELTPRGGKATVEFVAGKAGVFQFACGIDPAVAPYKGRADACDLDHPRQVGYVIVLDR